MSTKKKLIWISVLGILLIATLALFGWSKVYERSNSINGYLTTISPNNASLILDLKEGDVYQQSIQATRDEVLGFAIRFGTHQKTVSGKVKISFSDYHTGEKYYEDIVECINFADNLYYQFPLDRAISDGHQKKYNITLEVVELSEDQKLSLFASAKDSYANGELVYNGVQKENLDISCQLLGASGFLFKWYLLACVIIVVGYAFLAFFMAFRKTRLEYLYLILALVFGSVFILCFPPYTAPDEARHISTTYVNANRLLGIEPAVTDEGIVIYRGTDKDVNRNNQVNLARFSNLYDAIKYPSDNFERDVSWGTELQVPFWAYAPQIIGVSLGILLKLSGFWTLYLGKIFAMLFFTGCVFFSIKCIPWGKKVIMGIALLPMTLELASSFSYDCIVIALSLVFVSYAMRLIYEKEYVTKRDILFLGAVMCIMAPCKMAYFPIGGILYLIPSKKYKSKKLYWIINTGIIVAGIVVLLIYRYQFFADSLAPAQSTGDEAAKYTVAAILGDIPNSIQVLFNTFMDKTAFYFSSILGASLGWLQVHIPEHVIAGFAGVLLLAGITSTADEPAYGIDRKFRIVNWGLSSFMFLGILGALWIDWTVLGCEAIEGVQGRYFLPFLPLIILPLRNKMFTVAAKLNDWLIGSTFVLLVATFLGIVPYVFT